ncbi:MAG: hypothetical protein V2J62_01250 [candidate division KSB1 bacterium]|jgi:hypothetical protein|nr:hypothetical protein [candidate division KSB1 bacterium]
MLAYKPKRSASNTVLMLAVLVMVIFIILYLNSQSSRLSKYTDLLEQIDGSAQVVERTYYNKPLRFSITVPDSTWRFQYSDEMDTTGFQSRSSLDPMPLLRIYAAELQDTSVISEISVFHRDSNESPEKLAQDDLVRLNHELPRISIVRDVTSASSASIIGAYFVVEETGKYKIPYPVQVRMFIVKEQFAFRMTFQCKRDRYEAFRTDIEHIIKNVRLL